MWSHAMWRTMHATALGYEELCAEQQQGHPLDALTRESYRAFYAGLGRILPCRRCGDSYEALLLRGGFLRALDTATSADASPTDLFDWTVRMHNAVSEEVHGSAAWTSERARADLSSGHHPSHDGHSPPILPMAVALAVGITMACAAMWTAVHTVRLLRKASSSAR